MLFKVTYKLGLIPGFLFILLWAILKRKKQMLGHLAIYVTMKNGTTEIVRLIDKPTDVRKAQKQLNMYSKMSSLLGSIVK